MYKENRDLYFFASKTSPARFSLQLLPLLALGQRALLKLLELWAKLQLLSLPGGTLSSCGRSWRWWYLWKQKVDLTNEPNSEPYHVAKVDSKGYDQIRWYDNSCLINSASFLQDSWCSQTARPRLFTSASLSSSVFLSAIPIWRVWTNHCCWGVDLISKLLC